MRVSEILDPKTEELIRKLMEASEEELKKFASATKQKHGLKEFDLYQDRKGHIELSNLEVDPESRKQGSGTRAMEDLISYADANNQLIWLSVAQKNDKTGTTSRSRLEKFYRRFGFVPNKGRNKDFELSMYAGMYRRPK